MKDALLLVDAINDFRHEDAEMLLESFRERHRAIVRTLGEARAEDTPLIYANDNFGVWDGNAPRLVEQALRGKARDLIPAIAPCGTPRRSSAPA
jgi:nicotinamidase-related amidase